MDRRTNQSPAATTQLRSTPTAPTSRVAEASPAPGPRRERVVPAKRPPSVSLRLRWSQAVHAAPHPKWLFGAYRTFLACGTVDTSLLVCFSYHYVFLWAGLWMICQDVYVKTAVVSVFPALHNLREAAAAVDASEPLSLWCLRTALPLFHVVVSLVGTTAVWTACKYLTQRGMFIVADAMLIDGWVGRREHAFGGCSEGVLLLDQIAAFGRSPFRVTGGVCAVVVFAGGSANLLYPMLLRLPDEPAQAAASILFWQAATVACLLVINMPPVLLFGGFWTRMRATASASWALCRWTTALAVLHRALRWAIAEQGGLHHAFASAVFTTVLVILPHILLSVAVHVMTVACRTLEFGAALLQTSFTPVSCDSALASSQRRRREEPLSRVLRRWRGRASLVAAEMVVVSAVWAAHGTTAACVVLYAMASAEVTSLRAVEAWIRHVAGTETDDAHSSPTLAGKLSSSGSASPTGAFSSLAQSFASSFAGVRNTTEESPATPHIETAIWGREESLSMFAERPRRLTRAGAEALPHPRGGVAALAVRSAVRRIIAGALTLCAVITAVLVLAVVWQFATAPPAPLAIRRFIQGSEAGSTVAPPQPWLLATEYITSRGFASSERHASTDDDDDETVPHVCRFASHGLNWMDFSFLSFLTYFERDHANFDAVFAFYTSVVAPVQPHAGPMDWTVRHQQASSGVIFVDFFSAARNLSVVAVRGTDPANKRDLLQDYALYLEAALCQILGLAVPGFASLPHSLLAQLIGFVAAAAAWVEPSELYYWHAASEYVRDAHRSRRVVVTGHSLGGAVAKIAGTLCDAPVAAISAPGTALMARKFRMDSDVARRRVATLVPAFDFIAGIDAQVGTTFDLPCLTQRGHLCHLLEYTIAALWKECPRMRGHGGKGGTPRWEAVVADRSEDFGR